MARRDELELQVATVLRSFSKRRDRDRAARGPGLDRLRARTTERLPLSTAISGRVPDRTPAAAGGGTAR